MTPSVSAVVVTFRSEAFISDCLRSLLAQSRPLLEIVVVDNGSTDRTCAIVRERFPGVRLIEMGQNTGFCRANNAGIAATRGDFVLIANPDTRLWSDCVERALAGFQFAERVGAVACKLLRFDGVRIDSAGQILTHGRKIQDRGFEQKDVGQYDTRVHVDSACGAMALYRREMIGQISLDGHFFDEDFFSHWEDMDVGWRARRFGWEVVYVPDAVAQHFRGGSQDRHTWWTRWVRMSGRSADLQYHIVKNRWLMMIKNERPLDYVRNAPFIWARDIAMLGYLTLFCPSALFRLVTSPAVFARAWQKRRRLEHMIQDASRSGGPQPA